VSCLSYLPSYIHAVLQLAVKDIAIVHNRSRDNPTKRCQRSPYYSFVFSYIQVGPLNQVVQVWYAYKIYRYPHLVSSRYSIVVNTPRSPASGMVMVVMLVFSWFCQHDSLGLRDTRHHHATAAHGSPHVRVLSIRHG
jgi:hypothetical protein